MKVIILAGGYGTRLAEYTSKLPKPLVKIGNLPIIMHIINHYIKYDFNEIYILTGYKYKEFEKFFLKKNNKAKINLIYTGLSTMTGGRLKSIEKLFDKSENFLLTYGDAISDVNIKEVIKIHKNNKAIVTATTINPTSKYGMLKLNKNKVISFIEKPKFLNHWINGGFFVINAQIFKYIKNKKTVLEKEPFEKIVSKKKFFCHKHSGFWQCMDTLRDVNYLNILFKKKHKIFSQFKNKKIFF